MVVVNPLLSVIIPTFNSGKTIAGCLNGILNQRFRDFEVLIIDGISTDETLALAAGYNDSRIKIFSEKDEGIYDAMNKGIELAKGQWLYFTGADDSMYNPDVLETVFGSAPGNADVIYGNVKIKGNTSWSKDGDVYDGIFDTKKLFRKNICHQAVFYRSGFIKDKIGKYNTRYKLCADWDFNLRCWSKASFQYRNEIIAWFNAGGASTKSAADDNFFNDLLNNILTYFNTSVFDPRLNDSSFSRYDQVLALQRKNHYVKYRVYQFRRKIFNFFHS